MKRGDTRCTDADIDNGSREPQPAETRAAFRRKTELPVLVSSVIRANLYDASLNKVPNAIIESNPVSEEFASTESHSRVGSSGICSYLDATERQYSLYR